MVLGISRAYFCAEPLPTCTKESEEYIIWKKWIITDHFNFAFAVLSKMLIMVRNLNTSPTELNVSVPPWDVFVSWNLTLWSWKSQQYLSEQKRHISKHFYCKIENGVVRWNACVSLLKQTQSLSIIGHSDQSLNALFSKPGLPAVLLYCSPAWFGAFYYHGYCHKSRGWSERHGTRTNFHELASASWDREVDGQNRHVQMIHGGAMGTQLVGKSWAVAYLQQQQQQQQKSWQPFQGLVAALCLA